MTVHIYLINLQNIFFLYTLHQISEYTCLLKNYLNLSNKNFIFLYILFYAEITAENSKYPNTNLKTYNFTVFIQSEFAIKVKTYVSRCKCYYAFFLCRGDSIM